MSQKIDKIKQILIQGGEDLDLIPQQCWTKLDQCRITKDEAELFHLIKQQMDLGGKWRKPIKEILFQDEELPQNNQKELKRQYIYSKTWQYQELKNSYQEVSKIEGSFFEKHLRRLLLSNFIKKHPDLIQEQYLKINEIKIDNNQEIKNLKQTFKFQDFNSKIQTALKKLENEEEFQRSLFVIEKQFLQIDTLKFSFRDKINTQVAEKVKQKLGTIFIGFTGSGKSTSILSLCGIKMIRRKWKQLSWITCSEVQNDPDILKIMANPSSKSVTKVISSVLLKNWIQSKNFDQQSYFFDIPGFEDTENITARICNSIGLHKVIKQLSKVKFVVVFKKNGQGNRFQGLKKLVQTLSKLFPKYKNISKSIIPIFNNYKINQRIQLQNIFKQLKTSYATQQNKNILDIYNYFIEKTSTPQQFLSLNPLKQDTIKQILQKILLTPSHEKCQIALQLDNLSSYSISKHIQKFRILAIKYFRQEKLDVTKYYIYQIKILQTICKSCQIEANNLIEEVQKEIFKSLQEKNNQTKIKFDNEITQNSNKTIQEFIEVFNKIKTYEQFFKDEFKFTFSIKLDQFIIDKIKNTIQTVKNMIENTKIQTVKILNLLFKNFQRLVIEKLKTKFIQYLQLQYQQAQKYYFSKYLNGQFNGLIGSFKKYQLLQLFLDIITESNQRKMSLSEDIKKYLNEQQNKINRQIKQIKTYKIEDFKSIEVVLVNFQNMSGYFQLNRSKIEKVEQLEEIISLLFKNLNDQIKQVITEIKQYLINQHQNLVEIQQFYFIVRKQTHDKIKIIQFINLQSQIKIKLNKTNKQAKNIIQSIQKENDFVGLKKLFETLQQLILQIQRYSSFQQYNEQLSIIENTILDIFNKHTNLIENNDKNILILDKIKNISIIVNVILLVSAFKMVNCKSTIFLKISQKIENIGAKFKNICEQILNEIEDYFSKIQMNQILNGTIKEDDKNKTSLQLIDFCLSFFKAVNNLKQAQPEIQTKSNNLENQFVKKITIWQQNQKKKICSIFENLKNNTQSNVQLIEQNKTPILKIIREYQNIKGVLESTEQSLQQETVKQINIIFQQYNNQMRKSNQNNCIDQKSGEIFSNKILRLETLRCYIQKSLLSEIDCNMIKQAKNNFQFFTLYLEIGKIQEALKVLQKLQQQKDSHYNEAYQKFINYLSKKKTYLQQKKSVHHYNYQQMKKMIVDIQNVLVLRKHILCSQIKRSQNLVKIQTQILKQINFSIKQKIKKYLSKEIIQIKSLLDSNKIQIAYIKLNYVENIRLSLSLPGIEKCIDQKQVVEVQKIINDKIQSFKKLFKDLDQSSQIMKTLKIDFKNLFDYNIITNSKLKQLQILATKSINQLIKTKINNLQKVVYFKQSHMDSLNLFIKKLPEKFYDQNNVKQLKNKKLKQWKSLKTKIKTQKDHFKLFDSNNLLSVELIQFFTDSQQLFFGCSIKTTYQRRIFNTLESLIKKWEDLPLNQFILRINTSPQFQKTSQIHHKITIPTIDAVFENIYKLINKTIIQKMEKQINTLQQSSKQQNNVHYQTFSNHFIQYTTIISEQDRKQSQLYSINTKNTIKTLLKNYFIKITKKHKQCKNIINNFEKVFLSMKKSGIDIGEICQKLLFVKNTEKAITFFIESTNHFMPNEYVKLLNQQSKDFQKLFVMKYYTQIIQKRILPKCLDLLNFQFYDIINKIFDDQLFELKVRQKILISSFYFSKLQKLLTAAGKQKPLNWDIDFSRFRLRRYHTLQAFSKQVFDYLKTFNNQGIKTNELFKKMLILNEYNLFEFIRNSNFGKFRNQMKQTYSKMQKSCFKKIENIKQISQQRQNEILNFQQQILIFEQNKATANYISLMNNINNQINGNISLNIEDMRKIQTEKFKSIEQSNNQLQQSSHETRQKLKIQSSTLVSQQEAYKNNQIFDIAASLEKLIYATKILPDYLLNKQQDLIRSICKTKYKKLIFKCLNQQNSLVSKVLLLNMNRFNFASHMFFDFFQIGLKAFQNSITFIFPFKQEQLHQKYQHFNQKYQQQMKSYCQYNLQNNTLFFLKKLMTSKLLGRIFARVVIAISLDIKQNIKSLKPTIQQFICCQLLKNNDNSILEVKNQAQQQLLIKVMSAYYSFKSQVHCLLPSNNEFKKFKYNQDQTNKIVFHQKEIKFMTFSHLPNLIQNGFLNRSDIQRFCNEIFKSKQSISNSFVFKIFFDKNNVSQKLFIKDINTLFDEQFYGKTCLFYYKIQNDNIKKIYDFIWKNRFQVDLINKVLLTQQFKKISNFFPKLQNLIKEHVYYMVFAVKNHMHSYTIKNNKITYKTNCGYSSQLQFGYKTIFSYFYEYQRGFIQYLPSQCGYIPLLLFETSYTELSKMYKSIIGITNDLNNISDYKKKVLQKQYNIKQNYCFVPPRKIFINQIMDLILYLTTSIMISSLKIQLVIILKTNQYYTNFLNLSNFKKYLKNTVVFTKRYSLQNLQTKILNTLQNNKIAIISRDMIRNVDFNLPKKLFKYQSIHLICTFIPKSIEQQIYITSKIGQQIQQKATTIFIINEIDLKAQLSIVFDRQQAFVQLQTNIRNKIKENQKNQIEIIQRKLNQSKIKHKKSIELLNYFSKNQKQDVLKTIINQNTIQFVSSKSIMSKIVIAINMTKSMSRVLLLLKSAIHTIFENIKKKIDVTKVPFIQIVCYRSYQSQEDQLLEYSPFEFDYKILENYLENQQTSGGWSNGALEVVFDHCLKIKDLNKLIIISDVPANSPIETINKRNSLKQGYGQQYWSKTDTFSKPINSDTLVNQLRKKNVNIHALVSNQQSILYFKTLTQNNNGQYQLIGPQSFQKTCKFIEKCIFAPHKKQYQVINI